MTYSITFTQTSCTIRKGAVCRRTTVTPALIAAYASLYALHGDKVLPRLWADMVHEQRVVAAIVPARNRDYTTTVPVAPTSPACSIPARGPTLQPRVSQLRHLYKSPTQSSIWQKPGR